MSLERLWLTAWLEELRSRTPEPAVRPVSAMSEWVRLDDTGRDLPIPLRPADGAGGGERA